MKSLEDRNTEARLTSAAKALAADDPHWVPCPMCDGIGTMYRQVPVGPSDAEILAFAAQHDDLPNLVRGAACMYEFDASSLPIFARAVITRYGGRAGKRALDTLVPIGWRIEYWEDNSLWGIEIQSPDGCRAVVYKHDSDPANVLYRLANTLLSASQPQAGQTGARYGGQPAPGDPLSGMTDAEIANGLEARAGAAQGLGGWDRYHGLQAAASVLCGATGAGGQTAEGADK